MCRRSVVFRSRPVERMEGRQDDDNYDNGDDDSMTSTGFTFFNHNLERGGGNMARTRGDQDR